MKSTILLKSTSYPMKKYTTPQNVLPYIKVLHYEKVYYPIKKYYPTKKYYPMKKYKSTTL